MNALPDAADFDHLGFTLPELGYLLASRPGRPADAMRTVFGADSIAESTSLVDRGYLEAGQLRGEAAAIAAILTRATRWSVADVSAGDIVERGILVESEIGKLIARQRAGRTWWFIVLDPESVVSQVLAQGVRRLAHRGEPLAATVRTASLTVSRTFVVQRSGDAWRFCAAATGAREPEIHVSESTSDEAIEHLSAFVAVWPEPLLA